jgi:hypothetical protein
MNLNTMLGRQNNDGSMPDTVLVWCVNLAQSDQHEGIHRVTVDRHRNGNKGGLSSPASIQPPYPPSPRPYHRYKVLTYCTSATDFCANKKAVEGALRSYLTVPKNTPMTVASTAL